MREIYHKNKTFISVFFLFITGLIFLLLLYEKDVIHLAINRHHAPALDIFFRYLTYLGDGWAVLFLFIIFLFIRFRLAWMLAISNLIITFVVQFLKKIMFSDSLRPKAWFENIYDLYFVPGVNVHTMHSFPSGHSATAFSVFFFLSLLSDKPIWKFISVTLAILTAFSRVYLSQHFMEDIFLGSVIGFLLSFLVYSYFEIKFPGKFEASVIKSKH